MLDHKFRVCHFVAQHQKGLFSVTSSNERYARRDGFTSSHLRCTAITQCLPHSYEVACFPHNSQAMKNVCQKPNRFVKNVNIFELRNWISCFDRTPPFDSIIIFLSKSHTENAHFTS